MFLLLYIFVDVFSIRFSTYNFVFYIKRRFSIAIKLGLSVKRKASDDGIIVRLICKVLGGCNRRSIIASQSQISKSRYGKNLLFNDFILCVKIFLSPLVAIVAL